MSAKLCAFLAISATLISAPLRAQTVTFDRTFTPEEAKTLKTVLDRDKMLESLVSSRKILSGLNKALSYTGVGPIKLVFQWNQALFDGWAKANSNLQKIANMTTCDDLMFPIINGTPNADVFEKLSNIRGC